MSASDGERVTTGSEPRRARVRAKCHGCGGSGMGYPPYEAGCEVCQGKGIVEVEGEVVEPGHDEQTDWKRLCQNLVDPAPGTWQKALREAREALNK
jgi:DnaJ-class molecular chaperone